MALKEYHEEHEVFLTGLQDLQDILQVDFVLRFRIKPILATGQD